MFNAEDLSLLQAVIVVEIFAANQKILVIYSKVDNLYRSNLVIILVCQGEGSLCMRA